MLARLIVAIVPCNLAMNVPILSYHFHPLTNNKPSILYRRFHMVVNRAQSNRFNSLESETISDSESDHSRPEVFSRAQMIKFDDSEILNGNRDSAKDSIEQKFSDMNRQIGELTNIALLLTGKLSSNTREGNGLNTLSTKTSSCSDTNFKEHRNIFGLKHFRNNILFRTECNQ